MRIPPKQVWENGYGWICPYCKRAQDEREKNPRGIQWQGLVVCQRCAPQVQLDPVPRRADPEIEGAPI